MTHEQTHEFKKKLIAPIIKAQSGMGNYNESN